MCNGDIYKDVYCKIKLDKKYFVMFKGFTINNRYTDCGSGGLIIYINCLYSLMILIVIFEMAVLRITILKTGIDKYESEL